MATRTTSSTTTPSATSRRVSQVANQRNNPYVATPAEAAAAKRNKMERLRNEREARLNEKRVNELDDDLIKLKEKQVKDLSSVQEQEMKARKKFVAATEKLARGITGAKAGTTVHGSGLDLPAAAKSIGRAASSGVSSAMKKMTALLEKRAVGASAGAAARGGILRRAGAAVAGAEGGAAAGAAAEAAGGMAAKAGMAAKGLNLIAMAATLVMEGVTQYANETEELALLSRKRILSYGRGKEGMKAGPGTRFATDTDAEQGMRDEIVDISNARKRAGQVAAEFNLSADDIQAAQRLIADQTGEMYSEMGPITYQMGQMAQMGAMEIADAAALFVEERRRFDSAPAKVLKEMRGLMDESRAISDETGKVINVEDYTLEVRNLRASLGDAGASIEDTSKIFGGGYKAAVKMGASLERAISGAKKFAEGLTMGYDAGFGTVEVDQDVGDLLTREDLSDEQRSIATQVKQGLESGSMTPDIAASLIQKSMGSKLAEVRMTRTLKDGNLNLAQARGLDVTDPGLFLILTNALNKVAAGGDAATVAAEAMKLSATEAAAQEADRASAASATMTSNLNKIAESATLGARSAALTAAMGPMTTSALQKTQSAARLVGSLPPRMQDVVAEVGSENAVIQSERDTAASYMTKLNTHKSSELNKDHIKRFTDSISRGEDPGELNRMFVKDFIETENELRMKANAPQRPLISTPTSPFGNPREEGSSTVVPTANGIKVYTTVVTNIPASSMSAAVAADQAAANATGPASNAGGN